MIKVSPYNSKRAFKILLWMLLIITVLFLATGCAGTKKVLVTEYKYQMVEVPEDFSKNCVNRDFLSAYPETPVHLGREASLIAVNFYDIAKICQLGAQATVEYLSKAKIIVESEGDPKTIKEKLARLANDVREKFNLKR